MWNTLTYNHKWSKICISKSNINFNVKPKIKAWMKMSLSEATRMLTLNRKLFWDALFHNIDVQWTKTFLWNICYKTKIKTVDRAINAFSALKFPFKNNMSKISNVCVQGSESFQVEHIHVPGGWDTPALWRRKLPRLGPFHTSPCVPDLHLAVHLYSSSYPLLYNKPVSVSKCFLEFCSQFWQIIESKVEEVMGTLDL